MHEEKKTSFRNSVGSEDKLETVTANCGSEKYTFAVENFVLRNGEYQKTN